MFFPDNAGWVKNYAMFCLNEHIVAKRTSQSSKRPKSVWSIVLYILMKKFKETYERPLAYLWLVTVELNVTLKPS